MFMGALQKYYTNNKTISIPFTPGVFVQSYNKTPTNYYPKHTQGIRVCGKHPQNEIRLELDSKEPCVYSFLFESKHNCRSTLSFKWH